MKEAVIKRLVKYGWNKIEAEKIVNKNYDLAIKMYENASVSKIADIVCYV